MVIVIPLARHILVDRTTAGADDVALRGEEKRATALKGRNAVLVVVRAGNRLRTNNARVVSRSETPAAGVEAVGASGLTKSTVTLARVSYRDGPIDEIPPLALLKDRRAFDRASNADVTLGKVYRLGALKDLARLAVELNHEDTAPLWNAARVSRWVETIAVSIAGL